MTQALKTCTLIGSDKGGVGKSMIALILGLANDQASRPFRIIEIDHQMKLRSVMGDRVDLSLKASPELRDVTRNRHAAESFYNPVYEMWTQSDSVTDLGANVTTSLLEWIRECDIPSLAEEDNIAFRFVAITTPDDQAMKSAVSAIEEVAKTFGSDASMCLIMNDISGDSGFAPYKGTPHFERLMQMRDEFGLTVMEMPYCDSILMDHGKAKSMSPLAVLNDAERLAEEIGMDRVSARVHKRKLVNWLFSVQKALAPLFTPVRRQTPSASNTPSAAA